MHSRKVLSFFDTHRLSVRHKLPLPKQAIVQSLMEGLQVADRIGYPVVLKALSSELTHKTDAKLVVVDVRSSQELSSAYHKIIDNVHKAKRNARLEGMLIQEFIPGDVQVIVGGKVDPSFGPVVLVGAGGVFAEVFDDTVVRVCPISRNDARLMVHELKMKKVFENFRGIATDESGIIDTLLKVSEMVTKESSMSEIDINPLIVTSKNVFAVDVRIIV